jgi:hypothetical protein
VKAKEFEHKSETFSQESEKLIEQHHTYAYAVAILQISVPLPEPVCDTSGHG